MNNNKIIIYATPIVYKFKINELTTLNFDVFYGGAYRFGQSYERNLDVYLYSSPATREIVVSWNTVNKFCSNFMEKNGLNRSKNGANQL